ncbi:hypothetical protein K7G98_21130, partial [Saccharothrix sp. MB29]|nr:hypothetical protein [Saccharothrix sp. MB29]
MVKGIAWVAVAAVSAAVSLTSCVRLVQESFDDQHVVTGGITEVAFDNGSGNVVVRSRPGASETEVRRHVRYPRTTDKPSGGTHRVE